MNIFKITIDPNGTSCPTILHYEKPTVKEVVEEFLKQQSFNCWVRNEGNISYTPFILKIEFLFTKDN